MHTFFITNQGGRDYNEDYCAFFEKDGEIIYALADGLGGHGKGEVASKIAVDTVIEKFKEAEELNDDFIEESFTEAQNNVLKEQARLHAKWQAKTTFCVVLITKDGRVKYGHIGDSRIYFFGENKIIGRTLDHSVPQMLVNAGTLKDKKIRNHPDRNRLLKCIGNDWDGTEFELGEDIFLADCKAILLAVDGFWELIEDKKMVKTLKNASDAKDWLDQMTLIVQKNGQGTNMDNYTAIASFPGALSMNEDLSQPEVETEAEEVRSELDEEQS